jgi:hypothetical protein
MVEKKIFVLGLAVVLALGTLGFNWVETILPAADAHGVQAQEIDGKCWQETHQVMSLTLKGTVS